ncbi:MAG TPA: nucleotidyl transferase AbiEii/AbiGii toxin family protein [Thermoanaerobaculia bacterium]|jgi:hypothetical protein|nr:nucleotidyl transferase AbiEii/AbiGii toxin family protein [Thermoanaerobaculia bacterium]
MRLAADLQAGGLKWALVGGFAVTLRAEPRTTRDIDVVLALAGEREAEAAALHLRLRGYRDHPEGGLIEWPDGRIATIRLVSPPVDDEAGTAVDLLITSSGVETEVVAAAEVLEILPRFTIPVARAGHLLALKVLANRPKDHEDARSLLREMDLEEVQMARETLVLIAERGFNRDRELLIELARLVDSRE